ncbi:hypothetical protein [Tenacibaculum sp. nBUS_03]|uniref:hypothetical protein n=1 Tax=Tenacibaculum sp. nBUS_03 TaxID=3395320 RepID=UPI003EBCBCDB
MENLSKHYHSYSEKEKFQFRKFLDQLMWQFSSSLKLEEPYRLILDSNILMRLNDLNEKPTPNLLSILVFFDFLKFQETIKISILIRPTVFFEFYEQKDIKNEIEHWEKYKKLKNLIEDNLNVRVYTEGIYNYELTKHHFENIKYDINLIKNELKKINSTDWKFEFKRGFGEFDGFPLKDGTGVLTTPHQVGKELAPDLQTKYLNSKIVKLCLANHISYNISNNDKNNQDVITKYTNDKDFTIRKIIKLTNKGLLKGLADLDLLFLCNIQNQFENQSLDNYLPSSLPLTLDENLFKSLNKFSSLVLNSYFKGGEKKESIKMKFEKEFEEKKRVERAEVRLQKIHKKEKEYYYKLSQYFDEKKPTANKV